MVRAIRAVQHQDRVSVLFDGTRFPQVGHSGTVILPVFRGTVHLGQGNHRNLQFPGQRLESAADLGHLFLAGIPSIFRLNQLEVIDSHHADALAFFQAAGVGRDPQHALGGGIVDEQRGLAQFATSLDQKVHLVRG